MTPSEFSRGINVRYLEPLIKIFSTFNTVPLCLKLVDGVGTTGSSDISTFRTISDGL